MIYNAQITAIISDQRIYLLPIQLQTTMCIHGAINARIL